MDTKCDDAYQYGYEECLNNMVALLESLPKDMKLEKEVKQSGKVFGRS